MIYVTTELNNYRLTKCRYCQNDISNTKRIDAKFCSNSCRVRSYQKRKENGNNNLIAVNGGNI